MDDGRDRYRDGPWTINSTLPRPLFYPQKSEPEILLREGFALRVRSLSNPHAVGLHEGRRPPSREIQVKGFPRIRMFGKWFDTAYTGSMAGAGADVFAVWTYVIANADHELVELNPAVVAALIGMPVENVERAIAFLCQPDPKSRNPEQEGRRLVFHSGYLYEMVSFPIYRAMRDTEKRREYKRQKQRELRERQKATKRGHLSTPVDKRGPAWTGVDHGGPPYPEAEAEAEGDVVLVKNTKTSSAKEADASPEPALFPDLVVEKVTPAQLNHRVELLWQGWLKWRSEAGIQIRATYTLTAERRKKALARLKESLTLTGGDLEKAMAMMHWACWGTLDNPWNNGTDPANAEGRKFLDWETHVFGSEATFAKRIEFYKELEAKRPGYRQEDDWTLLESG